MNSTHRHNFLSQRGATLIISLLMLLVMTLIGVTAIQTTTMEEKMAGNMRDQNLAFQAAEAALRAGEGWMGQQTSEPVPQPSDSCSKPPCDLVWQLNILNGGDFSGINWWTTTSDVRVYDNPAFIKIKDKEKKVVKTAPKYLLEYHSFIRDGLTLGKQSDKVGRHVYRVTARGTGGTDQAQAILQSTYTRRF